MHVVSTGMHDINLVTVIIDLFGFGRVGQT